MIDVFAKALRGQEKASDYETVVVFDEEAKAVFRVKVPFEELVKNLPETCRWLPDVYSLRLKGMIFGAVLPILLVICFVAIAVQVSYLVGVLGALFAFIMIFLGGLGGWIYGPGSPWHDYRPIWVVRRRWCEKDAPALSKLAHVVGERVRYVVPYEHSFLNLKSLEEEAEDTEYTPVVVRASTVWADAQMHDERDLVSAPTAKWDKIKIASLAGIIVAMLIALILLVAVTSE